MSNSNLCLEQYILVKGTMWLVVVQSKLYYVMLINNLNVLDWCTIHPHRKITISMTYKDHTYIYFRQKILFWSLNVTTRHSALSFRNDAAVRKGPDTNKQWVLYTMILYITLLLHFSKNWFRKLFPRLSGVLSLH